MTWYVAVITTEDVQEAQPPFFREYPVRSFTCTCLICGSVWASCTVLTDQGAVRWWQGREAVCDKCGDGSFLQYPTRWATMPQGSPEEQSFGPLLMQRELDLAIKKMENSANV